LKEKVEEIYTNELLPMDESVFLKNYQMENVVDDLHEPLKTV